MRRQTQPRAPQPRTWSLHATYRPMEYMVFRVADDETDCEMDWNPETGEFMFVGTPLSEPQARFREYREAMTVEANEFLGKKPAQREATRLAAMESLRKMAARMEAAEKSDSKWTRSYLKGELFSVVSYLDNSLEEDNREEDYVLYYTVTEELASE